jgi:hypothetical protein
LIVLKLFFCGVAGTINLLFVGEINMDSMQKALSGLGTLAVMVVLMYVVPGVGDSVSTAIPVNATGDFADVTTGASVYSTGVKMLTVVVLMVFVGYALDALFGLGIMKKKK